MTCSVEIMSPSLDHSLKIHLLATFFFIFLFFCRLYRGISFLVSFGYFWLRIMHALSAVILLQLGSDQLKRND